MNSFDVTWAAKIELAELYFWVGVLLLNTDWLFTATPGKEWLNVFEIWIGSKRFYH